jgi:phage tail-like protein
MSEHNGWLLAQLPQAMARDRVIAGFVRGFQEVADSIRERMSTVDYELDVDLASPEMLRYLATWLGVEVESIGAADDLPAREDQRRLIRAVGQVLGWRGTRRGLEILLEALTGGRAEVSDNGGVFSSQDKIPPADNLVRVVLDDMGRLSERQIMALLEQELPVGSRVELRVRSQERGGGRHAR